MKDRTDDTVCPIYSKEHYILVYRMMKVHTRDDSWFHGNPDRGLPPAFTTQDDQHDGALAIVNEYYYRGPTSQYLDAPDDRHTSSSSDLTFHRYIWVASPSCRLTKNNLCPAPPKFVRLGIKHLWGPGSITEMPSDEISVVERWSTRVVQFMMMLMRFLQKISRSIMIVVVVPIVWLVFIVFRLRVGGLC